MKVIFEHPVTGEIKETPLGFSWTTLLFGVFVSLIRGDWKWAIIMFLVALLTVGLYWLVFPFIYNKLWAKELVMRGFKVKNVIEGDIRLAENEIGLKLEKIQNEIS